METEGGTLYLKTRVSPGRYSKSPTSCRAFTTCATVYPLTKYAGLPSDFIAVFGVPVRVPLGCSLQHVWCTERGNQRVCIFSLLEPWIARLTEPDSLAPPYRGYRKACSLRKKKIAKKNKCQRAPVEPVEKIRLSDSRKRSTLYSRRWRS